MATASRYTLSGKKLRSDWSGQKKMVADILSAADSPLLVSEIATELEANPKFTTVQTSERIAAYYICVLKKDGFVVEANDDDSEPNLENLLKIRDSLAARLDAIVEQIEALTVPTVENN